MLVDVEAALAPFGARPHWGKALPRRRRDVAPLYERLADFARLAQRLDPRGAFRNDWLERHVLAGGGPLSSGGQALARREPVLEQRPRRGGHERLGPRAACDGGAGPRRLRSGAGRERRADGRRRR